MVVRRFVAFVDKDNPNEDLAQRFMEQLERSESTIDMKALGIGFTENTTAKIFILELNGDKMRSISLSHEGVRVEDFVPEHIENGWVEVAVSKCPPLKVK